jgi:hypothetical protein
MRAPEPHRPTDPDPRISLDRGVASDHLPVDATFEIAPPEG